MHSPLQCNKLVLYSCRDRLYSLQRTKEKLEEQIDLANKALSETPKKYVSRITTFETRVFLYESFLILYFFRRKPGFFKKIFKKSGPSKVSHSYPCTVFDFLCLSVLFVLQIFIYVTLKRNASFLKGALITTKVVLRFGNMGML